MQMKRLENQLLETNEIIKTQSLLIDELKKEMMKPACKVVVRDQALRQDIIPVISDNIPITDGTNFPSLPMSK
jgi:hypothetical protein